MNVEPSSAGQRFELPPEWWLRLGHDLRGPIAPMRIAVQLLRSERAQPLDRDDALKVIDRQIDQLLESVDDISDIIRLNADKFSLNASAADLNLVLDLVCGRSGLSRLLGEKQIELRCVPAPSAVEAVHDPARLASLLEFLVRKSAGHAAIGATLTLALRDDAGRARLSIVGAGPSLAGDPGFAYVTGDSPVSIGMLEAKPIVMKEIARMSNISFSPFDDSAGVCFWMPLPVTPTVAAAPAG